MTNKLMHIDDAEEWRTDVKDCLKPFNWLEVTGIEDAHKFFSMPSWGGFGLYILDRHLPANPREHPNDNSWKTIADTLRMAYPKIPVVMLSSHPPRRGDFMKYGIRDALSKGDFRQNPSRFLSLVETYLERD